MTEGRPRTEVKICGVSRRADVEAAAAAGADYLGLVFADSPRQVDPSAAARMVEGVGVRKVGVFVDAAIPVILRTAQVASLDVVQLHGDESPEECAVLRGTGLEVWKALRPRGSRELAEGAKAYGRVADGLLVEGWDPEVAGGAGAAFPHVWVEEAGLAGAMGTGTGPGGGNDVGPGEGTSRPKLILAGGLTPESVGQAVRRLRPRVVDVSTGVEREPGVKDPEKVHRFVRETRAAAGADG